MLLMAAIVFLGPCNPARAPALVALGALLVATASATQDIVVDAFRIESLPENEQAAGSAAYVAAYRVGMLVSTAGALFLVSGFQAYGFGKAGGLAPGLCGDGGAGADWHRHRARSPPSPSARRGGSRPCASEAVRARGRSRRRRV